MSKAWEEKPHLHKWRQLRLRILARDHYQCQIKGPRCTHTATCVDHILGVRVSEDPAHLRAACKPCNDQYRPPKDPPVTGRTRW